MELWQECVVNPTKGIGRALESWQGVCTSVDKHSARYLRKMYVRLLHAVCREECGYRFRPSPVLRNILRIHMSAIRGECDPVQAIAFTESDIEVLVLQECPAIWEVDEKDIVGQFVTTEYGGSTQMRDVEEWQEIYLNAPESQKPDVVQIYETIERVESSLGVYAVPTEGLQATHPLRRVLAERMAIAVNMITGRSDWNVGKQGMQETSRRYTRAQLCALSPVYEREFARKYPGRCALREGRGKRFQRMVKIFKECNHRPLGSYDIARKLYGDKLSIYNKKRLLARIRHSLKVEPEFVRVSRGKYIYEQIGVLDRR